ncbi:DUF92 domain-containing protein [Brevibacillus sp. SYSU BS000544]|uniref:DUF92 domain-containing protein n=1 Tax=Brevibacillus sp. SYSU BS000544 TaxID=3416443 RepID=UPI003CE4AB4D
MFSSAFLPARKGCCFINEWLIGLLASAIISFAAYWKRSLSGSGVFGAILVGTILYAAGHLVWYGVLLAFFITSSLLTKWRHDKKAQIEEGYAKTGRRDFGQVLANGGIAAALCLLDFFWPHMFWYFAFIGIMASVTADTWATEIGSVSKRPPRSILTGKLVVPGTSGGVSTVGLLASFLGGVFIGGVAGLLSTVGTSSMLVQWWKLLVAGGISGLIGSLFDSLLGATWQATYQCKVCGKAVERKMHCNEQTLHTSGLPWLNNDLVNVISSVIGALFSVLIFSILL